MRGYNVPPWQAYGWRRVPDGVPTSEMRVSDAERHEIADALGKHYSEGRLDQSEFDDRMHQAMGAKTRGDLDGLLRDLPPLSAVEPNKPVGRTHRRSRTLLLLVGALLFLTATGSWVWNSFAWHVGGPGPRFPVVLLLVVAFLVLRRSHWMGHRYYRQSPPR